MRNIFHAVRALGLALGGAPGLVLAAALELAPGPALAVAGAGAQTLIISAASDESALQVGSQVVNEAFKRAGIGLSYKYVPLLRGIEEANDGITDGDSRRIASVTSLYPNLVMVPTPVNLAILVVYGGSSSIAGMTREQVSSLRLGVTRGSFLARKYSRGMNVVEARVRADLFAMLADGRVDAVMVDYVETQDLIVSGQLKLPTVLWPHQWASEPQYLMLHKRNAALVPRLDSALLQMRREGLMDGLRADMLREHRIPPPPPDDARAPAHHDGSGR